MSAGTNTNGSGPSASDDDGTVARCESLTWNDVDGRRWRIELMPQRIILRSGDDTVDLPESSWSRDIYIAEHGGGFIIRVDTFDCVLRFLVSREAATPLLAHLDFTEAGASTPVEAQVVSESAGELLWPKVSPLAVWALILSALAFVPIVGLLSAVVTVVLLVLHRLKVRRVAALRHSRRLCAGAAVLLITGLLVSALCTWGLSRYGGTITEGTLLGVSASGGRNWGVIAGGIIVVLFSLTVHEAAHAITAWWLGDGLARSVGRVTLNPLAHIDPIGTVVLPLILVLAGGPVFGYARPVPVRVESLPRRRRAHILISVAGPGSNLLLAAVSLMMLLAMGCLLRMAAPSAVVTNFAAVNFTTPVSASGFALAPAFGPLCTILKLSFIINTLLAMFNLIPIPPLDGSWVLEHLFPLSLGRLYARIRPYGFLIFLGAIYAGLFKYLMYPVLWILLPSLFLLAGATGY